MQPLLQAIFLVLSTILAYTKDHNYFNDSDTYAKDLILQLSKSPYVIINDITITNGATLTIENGVELIFMNGSLQILNGNLIMNCIDRDRTQNKYNKDFTYIHSLSSNLNSKSGEIIIKSSNSSIYICDAYFKSLITINIHYVADICINNCEFNNTQINISSSHSSNNIITNSYFSNYFQPNTISILSIFNTSLAINNCIFTDFMFNGIDIEYSEIEITSSIINGTLYSYNHCVKMNQFETKTLLLSNNKILNCAIGIGIGRFNFYNEDYSDQMHNDDAYGLLSIIRNNIINNTVGIVIYNDINNNLLNIYYNNIMYNGVNIILFNINNFELKYNYWGNGNGKQQNVTSNILDGCDNDISEQGWNGFIIFWPWLQSEICISNKIIFVHNVYTIAINPINCFEIFKSESYLKIYDNQTTLYPDSVELKCQNKGDTCNNEYECCNKLKCEKNKCKKSKRNSKHYDYTIQGNDDISNNNTYKINKHNQNNNKLTTSLMIVIISISFIVSLIIIILFIIWCYHIKKRKRYIAVQSN